MDATLVVIAFNERQRAPECVHSILAQRADVEFEVVVVDDGSTDGTEAAVREAARGNPRLRFIRLERNQGRGAARAAGVAMATGRAIGFVDADITLPPDWLARCLAELPGNAAVGGIAVPDGDATVLARISGASPRVVAGSMPITGNNVLFDAAALAETPFDPRDRLGEDFRLANRLARKGLRLRRVPGLIVRHEENKTYRQAINWRFENGLDASTHPREIGRLRFADAVWLGWLAAWVIGIAGVIAGTPLALALGAAVSVAVGVLHAATRFRPKPLGPFLLACLADVPLLNAYMLGRTVGVPRLVIGRP
jgi:glycosyltransferase involved in cell wall biosynthesis